MKKFLPWLFALLAIFLIAMIFKPVPIVPESECLVVEGVVAKIVETGVKDVGIRLEGDERRFYINRGLERGLELKKLQKELIGQEVVLKYPRYWTPLDPFDGYKHVSVLIYNSDYLFNECIN